MEKFLNIKAKETEKDRTENITLKKRKQDVHVHESEDTDFNESNIDAVAVIKKKSKISYVWKYFTRSNDHQIAKCNVCCKEYKTSGNTSNLADHIRRFHPNIEKDSEPESTNNEAISKSSIMSINSFFKKSLEYENNSGRKNELDKMLALMIATDFQPFNIVNDNGFRKFVKLLDPKYKIPSKFTIREHIMKDIYAETQQKLKDILNETKYVALTTDIWTAKNNDSYLTITCHFINENFELKNVVLATKVLYKNHTAENIAEVMQEICIEWGIENKISCIVTDNAANMIKACDIFKKRHLPCYAHTLNLIMQDMLGLECIKEILTKCKEIVRFFKSSTVGTEMLKKEQRATKTPEYKLIQEVSTRWNSSYYMVKRILEIVDALNQALIKLRNAPPPLTVDETIVLEDLEKIWSPFEEATKKISGSNYVTISMIIPLTYGIYNYLNNITQDLKTDEGKIVCAKVTESVIQRLFRYELRSVTRIATILDPRFKKEGFRNPTNSKEASLLLEQEMNNILRETTVTQLESTEITSPLTLPPRKSLFSFLEHRIGKKNKNVTADVIILKRQFLEKENASEKSDPLAFWKGIGEDMNVLTQLALKYLCIPGSSTASERTFSAAGQIISDRRSRLKPKNVDKLIFLNRNEWLSNS